MKKANIGVQTIFFIMMAAIMVYILIFGFNNLFKVSEELSEQELAEIRDDLEAAFEFCEDPLNKGNERLVIVRNKAFNSVCWLAEDNTRIQAASPALMDELGIIQEGGDNVILLKTSFTRQSSGSENFRLEDFIIIDSFHAEVGISRGSCQFDLNNSGEFRILIPCS